VPKCRGPPSVLSSLASAFTFGTVLPLKHAPGRGAGMVAALPVVGVALGLVAAAVLQAGTWAFGAHSLLTGALTVATLLMATRGLHIDGLADTADGLGCYGPAQRALAVMREGPVGPFGAATVVVVVLIQAAALSAMPPGANATAAAVSAVAAGRVAAVLAARRGVPAADGSTLGAWVAGSQSPWTVAGWTTLVAAVAAVATPRPWQGPLAVAVALIGAAVLVRHCVRRFGGVTGDVIGAAIELTTSVTLIGLAIRP